MNALTLAIAALSFTGDVYVQLTELDKKLIVFKDSTPRLFVVRAAIETTGIDSPIMRVGKVSVDVEGIVAVMVKTGDVWTIPFVDVAELSSIRLGKRWEKYRVRVEITTELDDGQKEVLKTAATKAARSAKGK